MSDMAKGAGKAAGALLAATAIGAATTKLLARNAGMSVRAWLLEQALPLARLPATQWVQAIPKDRAKGPSLPSRGFQARFRCGEETGTLGRMLTIEPLDGTVGERRILYIHGGAYVLDLSKYQWHLIGQMVRRTGARMVVPLYGLAPESDVQAGLAMVSGIYDRLVLEVGADNIAITGDSAGGGLSLALVHQIRDSGRSLPASLVLVAPWLDATVSGDGQPELARLDPILAIDTLREAGVMWANELAPRDPMVSPLFADQSGLPSTIVFTGTHDILHSDSVRFKTLQPNIELKIYDRMVHAWMVLGLPESDQAHDEASKFMIVHWQKLGAAEAELER